MEQFKSYPSELKSFVVFKISILKFIRPSPCNILNCDNHKGIRLMLLHIGMTHWHEHKFKHSFQDYFNPIWNCALDVEST